MYLRGEMRKGNSWTITKKKKKNLRIGTDYWGIGTELATKVVTWTQV